jgi:hypothetical protein
VIPLGPVFARVGSAALDGGVAGVVVVVVVTTGLVVVVVTTGFVVVVVSTALVVVVVTTGLVVVVVTTGLVVVVVMTGLLVVVVGGLVVVVDGVGAGPRAEFPVGSEGGDDVCTGSHAAPTITSANAQINTPAPRRDIARSDRTARADDRSKRRFS